MPIYEYRCTECEHRLEKLQKISDAPLVDCPECGKPALTKLVSAAGFRLKGGGWYETDFKDRGKRNLAGEQGSKNGEGGSKSESSDKPDSTAKPGKSDKAASGDSAGKSAGAGKSGSAASSTA